MGLGVTCEAGLLQAKWEEVVGKSAAKNSRPMTVKNHTLIVETTSPVWSHRLTMMKKEILDKAIVGEEKITDVRFTASFSMKESDQ
ncbi:MAG TPA: DUF721 domain-containing protein [Actinobacteria bacterium]|nr:DUF721 domain-containing protein [Actinomycetota bacterium]